MKIRYSITILSMLVVESVVAESAQLVQQGAKVQEGVVQQPAVIQQLQPIIIASQQISAASHKQSAKVVDEDDLVGAKILEIFATKLVPSFVQMVVGAESGDGLQEAAGIKSFASGVFEFISYATRHPEQVEELLEALENECLSEEDVYSTTEYLVRSLKESLASSSREKAQEEVDYSASIIVL